MSQTPIGKHNKLIDEYECSGNGPRPPVPGEESRLQKMTESSGSTAMTFEFPKTAPLPNPSLASATNPNDLIAERTRVGKWQEKLSNLLSDKKGVELFQRFVESEAGPHGIHTIHLEFYFACEGLKQQTDENIIRQIIGAIYRKYLRKEIQVSTELRNTIKKINKGEIPAIANILDTVQKSVENVISQTTYPSFLNSDLYRQHVEELQNAVRTDSFVAPTASVTATSSSSSSTTSLSSYDSLGACSTSLQEHLTKNSILPTLHEDAELAIAEDAAAKTLASSQPKLTKDLLLMTQKRRLEVRPPGAHGYISFHTSYNPVSRVDSERQSFSSGQTDSAKSLVSSKDGQPYSHRKQSSSETSVNTIKKGSVYVLNPKVEANQTVIGPVQKSRLENASIHSNPELFYNVLKPKLEKLKQEQDKQERLESALTAFNQTDLKSSTTLSMRSNLSTSVQRETQAHQKAFTAAIFKKFPQLNEDNDQDILDQHVSRVFSPHLSPGTISPCQMVASRPLPPLPHRALEPTTEISSTTGSQSMRHSKSVPEHAASTSRKLSNKWPSMYYDSGISLYSADLPYKSKETRLSREQQLEETRKILEDESRRPRKHGSQQLPTQSSTIQSHHTNSLPRVRDNTDEYTYAMYTFCDETIKYRTKIPGTQPTLKQFKDYLPKKGNFRFFFKTVCDDPDCPIIQEEISNDSDILPLFEGKIMGTVKPE